MTGQLEDEDILLKASEVKIKSATITKGFLQIQTEHISWLTFDYDMQIKEKTDVVVGKNHAFIYKIGAVHVNIFFSISFQPNWSGCLNLSH